MTTTARPLQEIPGVGPSIAADLRGLGIRSVGDLKGRDPERLYRRLCRKEGGHVDRCVLYVFRCAVYYAGYSSTGRSPDPDKLLWWNWKDSAAPLAGAPQLKHSRRSVEKSPARP